MPKLVVPDLSFVCSSIYTATDLGGEEITSISIIYDVVHAYPSEINVDLYVNGVVNYVYDGATISTYNG